MLSLKSLGWLTYAFHKQFHELPSEISMMPQQQSSAKILKKKKKEKKSYIYDATVFQMSFYHMAVLNVIQYDTIMIYLYNKLHNV